MTDNKMLADDIHIQCNECEYTGPPIYVAEGKQSFPLCAKCKGTSYTTYYHTLPITHINKKNMSNSITPKLILDAINKVQADTAISEVKLKGKEAIQLMTVLSHMQDSFVSAIRGSADPVVQSFLRQQLRQINELNENIQHQLAANLTNTSVNSGVSIA
jgi:hypothetical protein